MVERKQNRVLKILFWVIIVIALADATYQAMQGFIAGYYGY